MVFLKLSHNVVAASLPRRVGDVVAYEARRRSAVATAAHIFEGANNETG